MPLLQVQLAHLFYKGEGTSKDCKRAFRHLTTFFNEQSTWLEDVYVAVNAWDSGANIAARMICIPGQPTTAPGTCDSKLCTDSRLATSADGQAITPALKNPPCNWHLRTFQPLILILSYGLRATCVSH